jgi:hypothetical protein
LGKGTSIDHPVFLLLLFPPFLPPFLSSHPVLPTSTGLLGSWWIAWLTFQAVRWSVLLGQSELLAVGSAETKSVKLPKAPTNGPCLSELGHIGQPGTSVDSRLTCACQSQDRWWKRRLRRIEMVSTVRPLRDKVWAFLDPREQKQSSW